LKYLPIKQRPDHCEIKVEKNQQLMILLHELSGNFTLNDESLAKFSTLEMAACMACIKFW
jgi:hypothetical protein